MKDKGLDKGLVQQFETSERRGKGHFYGFRKMFWEYLNKLGVGFFDPCCPEASLKLPVYIDRITGLLNYINADGITVVTGQSGTASLPQNNIAAGVGGAISVTNYFTTINTDAGGDAFTLANGTSVGQLKKIQLVVDGGGDAVITPANLVGTTITMNDANDYVVLSWNGTDWAVIENFGATIA